MRALVQRVKAAQVSIKGETIAAIGSGLLILLGVAKGDTTAESTWLAGKCARLRVFADDEGKMNCSLLDCGGAALVVSQFTLYADTTRGNRPGFEPAALPAEAEPLYEHFMAELAKFGIPVQKGEFGADMLVSLQNDGPVTILLER
ncbi:MAG: D-tyrosyl-tRNA(Tyr) deacylase [Ruminococcaceae bacterium]|nr:D-tyrosyl-tRNA(Tyr) deacylase [Oscillospiraceae bacterium]